MYSNHYFRSHSLFLSLSKTCFQAKKKPIEALTPEQLGVDVKPRNKVLKVEDPPVRKAGIVVDSVGTLFDKLKNEAKVLK